MNTETSEIVSEEEARRQVRIESAGRRNARETLAALMTIGGASFADSFEAVQHSFPNLIRRSGYRAEDFKPRAVAFVSLTAEQAERLGKIKNPQKRLRAMRKMLITKSCLNCKQNYLNHNNEQLLGCLRALGIKIIE